MNSKLAQVSFAVAISLVLAAENVQVFANEDEIIIEEVAEDQPVEIVEEPVLEPVEEVVEEVEIVDEEVEKAEEDKVEVLEDETDNKEEVEKAEDEEETEEKEETEKEESTEKEDEVEAEGKEEVKEVVKEEIKVETFVLEETPAIIYQTKKVTRATPEQIARYVQPDFTNEAAYGYSNPYTLSWMGQCTWYTWGRFVEVYGYDPGFSGNGCDCAIQLVLAHPESFELSDTPTVGTIFSADYAHNHVGMIVGIEDGVYIVQEGNLNGRNDSLSEVADDCWTQTYTLQELKDIYGNVTFANPKTKPDASKLLTSANETKQFVRVVEEVEIK